ncbi:MAG: hypothetical protein ACK5MG_08055 [Bacteroidales bacterium]
MKQTIIILSCILATNTFFQSCSKDDNEPVIYYDAFYVSKIPSRTVGGAVSYYKTFEVSSANKIESAEVTLNNNTLGESYTLDNQDKEEGYLFSKEIKTETIGEVSVDFSVSLSDGSTHSDNDVILGSEYVISPSLINSSSLVAGQDSIYFSWTKTTDNKISSYTVKLEKDGKSFFNESISNELTEITIRPGTYDKIETGSYTLSLYSYKATANSRNDAKRLNCVGIDKIEITIN